MSHPSPITSVPEPDDEPGAAHALSSVITQVNPNAPASGAYARGAGPVRPVRVPRQQSGAAPGAGPAPSTGTAQTPATGAFVPGAPRPPTAPAVLRPTEPAHVAGPQVAQEPAAPATAPSSTGAPGSLQTSAAAAPTGQRPVNSGSASRTSTTAVPSAPRPKHEEQRPRGLRRLFAMMTCSHGNATASAAADADTHKNQPQKPPALTGASTSQRSSVAEPTPPSVPQKDRGNARRSSLQPVGGIQLPSSETMNVTSGGVLAPGAVYQGQAGAGDMPPPGTAATPTTVPPSEPGTEDEALREEAQAPLGIPFFGDMISEQELFQEEQRLIQQGGTGLPLDENGLACPLLSPLQPGDAARKCLVLDLDETLVHSSFKMVPNADFVVPVDLDGIEHNVYVIKRPGVDEFLRQMGRIFEVVVFTASLNKYADPVLDILDVHHVVKHRLFREACYNHHGNYVKDLSQLGRPLHDTIILDNSPASYIFHPTNAVPVSSWFNDPHDTELADLCPFLADLCHVQDVRVVLDGLLSTGSFM